MNIRKHSAWTWVAICLLTIGCSKPPGFDHDVEVIRQSAENGRKNVEDAKDPQKRKEMTEGAKRDLKNRPLQFK